MKWDCFDRRRMAAFFLKEIRLLVNRPLRIMEVCGTHTMAIFKAGLRQLLPPDLELISGPGCPVCVTPNEYIDTAIAYSRQSGVIIATFGDMLRLPGTSSSLSREKANGASVRTVYSALEAVRLAQENSASKVIFLAVGFEATSPTAAAAVLTAQAAGTANFYVLSAHKTIPPALGALLADPAARVDGLLLPGHVSAIIGEKPYGFIVKEHQKPAVIAGFDALDILQAVWLLTGQIRQGRAQLINQYKSVVRPDGNPLARQVLDMVYRPADAVWRGLGLIRESGLELREIYRSFDALASLPVAPEQSREPRGCHCGAVLQGLVTPPACPLFGGACDREHPVGPCMVSGEGACAAWYQYQQGRLLL